jgi:hypothetical protein
MRLHLGARLAQRDFCAQPPQLLPPSPASAAPPAAAQSRLGQSDFAFLATYALGMFCSGHLGDRVDLRIFLTVGACSRPAAAALLHRPAGRCCSPAGAVLCTGGAQRSSPGGA